MGLCEWCQKNPATREVVIPYRANRNISEINMICEECYGKLDFKAKVKEQYMVEVSIYPRHMVPQIDGEHTTVDPESGIIVNALAGGDAYYLEADDGIEATERVLRLLKK